MFLPHGLPDLVTIAEALDFSIRADLQDLRDSYFWWLIASSGVVAIGVILEGPEVIHETVGLFHRASDTKRSTPAWIMVLALFGWILIAVGVAGEGIAEAFVSKADGVVQTFNDILLTEARRETALALERASINEKEAEHERSSRIEFQERVEWRRLSTNEQALLARPLRRFSGHAALIVFNVSDSEASEFAFTIATALHLAHWKITSPYPGYFMPFVKPLGNATPQRPATGIHVGNSGSVESGKALVRELQNLGFDAIADHGLDKASGSSSKMMVLVDPRPEGLQGQAKLRFETAKRKTQTK